MVSFFSLVNFPGVFLDILYCSNSLWTMFKIRNWRQLFWGQLEIITADLMCVSNFERFWWKLHLALKSYVTFFIAPLCLLYRTYCLPWIFSSLFLKRFWIVPRMRNGGGLAVVPHEPRLMPTTSHPEVIKPSLALIGILSHQPPLEPLGEIVFPPNFLV